MASDVAEMQTGAVGVLDALPPAERLAHQPASLSGPFLKTGAVKPTLTEVPRPFVAGRDLKIVALQLPADDGQGFDLTRSVRPVLGVAFHLHRLALSLQPQRSFVVAGLLQFFDESHVSEMVKTVEPARESCVASA